jgi:hypothetical protein
MEKAGRIYRVRTNSISLGQQSWPNGTLISGERLGPLAAYFARLQMIEEVKLARVDQMQDDPRFSRAA